MMYLSLIDNKFAMFRLVAARLNLTKIESYNLQRYHNFSFNTPSAIFLRIENYFIKVLVPLLRYKAIRSRKQRYLLIAVAPLGCVCPP